MKLKNKTAIITGASQGFGHELAVRFAAEGANLVLAARNQEALLRIKKELEGNFSTNVEVVVADVSSENDNNVIADVAVKTFGTVDIFVANAGIYGPKGSIETVDWSEWCNAIAINLNGVVLGCRSVIPVMKKKKSGKIIILSGGGATKPMPFLSAYAVSKAGVIRFMETLAEELKEFNIDVNAIAPGALNTQLLDEVLSAGPEIVGKAFYEQSLKQKQTGGTPLEKGANLCVFLANQESDGIRGKLLSAVWDPWQSLPAHLAELDSTDIYTLRRIVPEDRNKKW